MHKKNKGFAMLLALIIISSLLIAITAIMSFSFYSQKSTIHTLNVKKIKYFAESGIENAIIKLKNAGVDPTVVTYPLPDNLSGSLIGTALDPLHEPIEFYSFNFKDTLAAATTAAANAHVSLAPEAMDNDNYSNLEYDVNIDLSVVSGRVCYTIKSIATNLSSNEKYTSTAIIDVATSFKGNDDINQMSSKTISAIDDMNSDTDSFNKASQLNITGSLYIQGNTVSINTSNADALTVNNTDKNHSGDSEIKLSSDLKLDNPNNVSDVKNYKWFGDFTNNNATNLNALFTPITLEEKTILGIQDAVTADDNPRFEESGSSGNDMVLWKVPSNRFDASGVLDFSTLPIKNYIVNRSGIFDSLLEPKTQEEIDQSTGYEDYIAAGDVNTAAANDKLIEAKYENLYKVILVDGDLIWNQPDYFSQSINWVIYCTGKITFKSTFTDPNDPTKFLSDNVNCTFVAKKFDFPEKVTGITADPVSGDEITATKDLVTKISFCNLKDTQKNLMYDYLEKNLSGYYDGLNVNIVGWSEHYGN